MEETSRNENPVNAQKAVEENTENAISDDAEEALDEPFVGEQNGVEKSDDITEAENDDQDLNKNDKNVSEAQDETSTR